MHVTNKIFLGLTLLLAPAYFYFVIVALGNQNKYQKEFLKCEAEIRQQQTSQWKLLHGADGIYQTRSKLSQLTEGRGRIWVTAQHSPYSPNGLSMVVSPLLMLASGSSDAGTSADGTGAANATAAAVSGLMPVRVELFEQVVTTPAAEASVAADATSAVNADGAANDVTAATNVQQQAKIGKYLGQFNVQANGASWTLVPTRELSPSLLAEIQDSKASWLVYEKMPKLRPNVIEKQADGSFIAKMRTSGEDQLLQVFDYASRLHTLNDDMVELTYQVNRIQLNAAQLQSAVQVASDNTKNLTNENTQLAADLQQTNKVYETVKLCVRTLRGRIEEVNQEIASTHDQNVKWVSELASVQRKVMDQLSAMSSSYASVP